MRTPIRIEKNAENWNSLGGDFPMVAVSRKEGLE